MSHQVCHCGWSKKTTYHGLRTHQGIMGCTAKGMRIPESKSLNVNTLLWGNLGRPQLDLYAPIKAADPSPDTSLQVCHCGWSKMTTHHGLRTHQGIMGCTEKGMRIPESKPLNANSLLWENLGLPQLDLYAPIKADPSPDTSLQVCHCGWSKVTTHHGLRTHQGMMECTPKKVRIPEREPHIRKDVWGAVNDEDGVTNESVLPGFSTPVKEEHRTLFETPQRSVQRAQNFQMVARALDFSSAKKDETRPQSLSRQTHPVATAKDEPRSFSVTLQHSDEMIRNVETAQQVQDFSADLQVKQERQDRIIADLQLKLLMRKQKMVEVKSSVKTFKGRLDREWLEINSVFSDAMKVVEEAREKALQPLEERRAKAMDKEQHLIQELQGEIDKLKKAISKLDTNFQVSPSLMTATVDTSFSFGTLRMTTSTMMEQIHQKLEKLSSVELKRFHSFAVDVKLDPSTAHRHLLLSADGKEVRDGGQTQEVPDAPERFDLFGSVLGRSSLFAPRSYWEVEVGDKTGWDLGVARGNANRRGNLSLNPGKGYWVVVHYDDEGYAALTEPPVGLILWEKPQTVGVFVDHDEGLVSFYDVKAQSHIHSFTGCSFRGEIFPYFSPHLKQDGKNSEPLIISAVRVV